jgi:hypothetical protein
MNPFLNNLDDWPQAPPPPMSYLPQLMTPQMFYQQQTSRYVPISQQVNKTFSDKDIMHFI